MKRMLLVFITCIALIPLAAMPPRYRGPHLELSLPTQTILKQYVPWNSYGVTPPNPDTLEMGGIMGNLIGLIPEFASITSTPDTGGIFQTGTSGARGGGVTISVTASAISFSTQLGYGIGWSYEIVEQGGKKVLMLKYTLSTWSGSSNGGIIITPEMLGFSADEVALNVITGRWHPSIASRLADGSALMSPDGPWTTQWQTWSIVMTTFIHD